MLVLGRCWVLWSWRWALGGQVGGCLAVCQFAMLSGRRPIRTPMLLAACLACKLFSQVVIVAARVHGFVAFDGGCSWVREQSEGKSLEVKWVCHIQAPCQALAADHGAVSFTSNLAVNMSSAISHDLLLLNRQRPSLQKIVCRSVKLDGQTALISFVPEAGCVTVSVKECSLGRASPLRSARWHHKSMFVRSHAATVACIHLQATLQRLRTQSQIRDCV